MPGPFDLSTCWRALSRDDHLTDAPDNRPSRRVRRTLVVALSLLFVLIGAGQSYAQLNRETLRVLDDVATEINRYSRYTVFDFVDARYDRGAVTLTGKVTMPFKRTEIASRVERVRGVDKVDNRIEVLPVSIFDDELRHNIARAIYGNPTFWPHAAMLNPPIHIVVENGRVTLVGVVRNEVERVLARSLATSFGAFSITNQLNTDAEVRAAREGIR